MRLSLLGSACTSAVLFTILTLPLQAQAAPQKFNIMIVGTGANAIHLHCRDASLLSNCIDGLNGLSRKNAARLKILSPKLRQELAQSLSSVQDHSSECLAMRVYQYPRGYPEKNAGAQPKVSDCTSAARVKVLMVGVKKADLSGQK